LLKSLANLRNISGWAQKATAYRKNVFKTMETIRYYCDELERIMPKNLWPFPTYADILFN
jgi:glutamine synthetase